MCQARQASARCLAAPSLPGRLLRDQRDTTRQRQLRRATPVTHTFNVTAGVNTITFPAPPIRPLPAPRRRSPPRPAPASPSPMCRLPHRPARCRQYHYLRRRRRPLRSQCIAGRQCRLRSRHASDAELHHHRRRHTITFPALANTPSPARHRLCRRQPAPAHRHLCVDHHIDSRRSPAAPLHCRRRRLLDHSIAGRRCQFRRRRASDAEHHHHRRRQHHHPSRRSPTRLSPARRRLCRRRPAPLRRHLCVDHHVDLHGGWRAITFVAAGACSITASQAGNAISPPPRQ